MDQEMKRNPDYDLVMKFLTSITPGDMDKESADQLMMIGQRIQAGGALTDKEREMFQSVVGAMPSMPMEGMQSGGMTDAQRAIMENEAYNRRLAEQMTMPSQDGMTYSKSSGVSMNPSAAPTTSMRPKARPMR